MDGALGRPSAARVITVPQVLRRIAQPMQGILRRALGIIPAENPTAVHLTTAWTLAVARVTARRTMVPRTKIVAIPATCSLEQLLAVVHQHPYTRYPVYERTLDNIIGIVSAKHVVAALSAQVDQRNPFALRAFLNEPLFIPHSSRADVLLGRMQQHRAHLAIVLDEYGATAGLVTYRDVMEQLLGEVGTVPDEWDTTLPTVQWLTDGSALVDGFAHLSDLQRILPIPFAAAEESSLGGFVFAQLGRRPTPGDIVTVEGYTLTVQEMDGPRVATVRVHKPNDLPNGATVAIPPAFLDGASSS